MKQRPARTVVILMLASVVGACSRSAPISAARTMPATSSVHPAIAATAAPRCRAAELTLRPGPGVSPMTGEHGAFYALVNRSHTACTIIGYPAVALYDARGALLPFRYTHHSQYVTRARPQTVLLSPQASAYVLIAKYRCDLRISRNAATIRLTLPGPQHAVLAIRASGSLPASSSTAETLSYCAGGPSDPGQVISVSPIEPVLTAAGPF
jgi:Protein of unknown function (DUF4232)